MFYFNGIFSTEALKDLFSPEFLEKIKNRQSGLVMKILKGFNQPGSFLGSIHVNDNERVLFTIIQHNNIPRISMFCNSIRIKVMCVWCTVQAVAYGGRC